MSKKEILKLSGLAFIAIITFAVIVGLGYSLIKTYVKRTTYSELTYYDFKISYDDDNYCYEIFTEDKTYTIRESKLDVKYDGDENYIVIYDNNYDWYYNKAILFMGVNEK